MSPKQLLRVEIELSQELRDGQRRLQVVKRDDKVQMSCKELRQTHSESYRVVFGGFEGGMVQVSMS